MKFLSKAKGLGKNIHTPPAGMSFNTGTVGIIFLTNLFLLKPKNHHYAKNN
jgi:hypothetical protein